MPIFFRLSTAGRVKSRSRTGIIPVADTAVETNKLPVAQRAEIFKVGCPLFCTVFVV
jgi:hypothetical protein